MPVVLEPPTPSDRSLLYRLHDAYFAQRGIAAWRDGDIPYDSTSNFAMARQHARLVAGLARGSEADPFVVLEVGGGLGRLAANLMAALDADHPDVAPRVRYVFSDYVERSVREAAATPLLAPLVAAGRVVPALLDVRQPGPARALDGAEAPAPHVLMASYVACVVPTRHLQRRADGWAELHVEIRLDTDAVDPTPLAGDLLAHATREGLLRELELVWSWVPLADGRAFADPLHAAVVEELVADLDEATVDLPGPFLDFLTGMRPHLAPGAAIVVTDYGTVEHERLEGLQERKPNFYGNTLNHEVHFGLFDAFARAAGWHVLRTDDPVAFLHTAVLRPDGPWEAHARRAFADAYVTDHEGADLLDFSAAARAFEDQDDAPRAIRFLRRCVRLAPRSAELHLRLGVACLEAGYLDLARRTLERALSLAPEGEPLDVAFELGRVCVLAGRAEEAEGWYRRSLAAEPHPVTWTNLSVLLEQRDALEEALEAVEAAAALDPESERVKERREQVQAAMRARDDAERDALEDAARG